MESFDVKQKLMLFQELISCGHALYYWSFRADGMPLSTTCPAPQHFHSVLALNADSLRKLGALSEEKMPVVMSGVVGLSWIADFEFDEASALTTIHAVGPVYIEEPTPDSVRKWLSSQDLFGGERQTLSELLTSLPVLSISRFFDFGLMLHYCLTGERITTSDFRYPVEDRERRHTRRKTRPTDLHGTWSMEQELLRLVEVGDLDYKKKAARLVVNGRVGQLGSGDPVRNLKNLTIIFTALCMRAAIRGGLTPETAYVLSDQYISAIESGNSFAEVAEVNAAMQEDFVQRVHRIRAQEGKTPLIENVCSYLHSHYAEKLEIPVLAASMGYSASRLTKLFKQETGQTVKEYLMAYRIDLAKDALRLTGESVQSICHRLGFESPSYFGKHFKMATGMSPLEYREKQGKGSVY